MKIKIKVCEKVAFIHEAVIEVSDTVNIDKMLDNVERKGEFDDILYAIEKDYACKVLDTWRDEDGGTPEIGITEYDEA